MKKLFVFITLGVIMSGICFAQTAKNEQRIIGTWLVNYIYSDKVEYGDTLVFNSNGTLLIGENSFEYGITETKLFINYSRNREAPDISGFYSYSISSDGKTLILEYTKVSGSGGNPGSRGIWLIKK